MVDSSFVRTYRWFREAIGDALVAVPNDRRQAVETVVWKVLGALADGSSLITDSAREPGFSDFKTAGPDAQSLAYAALMMGECMAAARTLAAIGQSLSSHIGDLESGNFAAIANDPAIKDQIDLVRTLVRQIDSIANADPSIVSALPSAFSIGKMLLTLSGDANTQPPAGKPVANEIAKLLVPQGDDEALHRASAALGIMMLFGGAVLDRAFRPPTGDAIGALWPSPPFPGFAGGNPVTLSLGDGAAFNLDVDLADTEVEITVPAAVRKNIGADPLAIDLVAAQGMTALFRRIGASDAVIDPSLSIEIGARIPLAIGPILGATLKAEEFGAEVRLDRTAPAISLFARKGQATVSPGDSFLAAILGGGLGVGFAIEAEADANGRLRFKNGSHLEVSLPVGAQAGHAFDLKALSFAIETIEKPDTSSLSVELATVLGVDVGPFKGVVEGMGVRLRLDNYLDANATPQIRFEVKPPKGIGLSIDTPPIVGGGYLYIDIERGEYAGALELKLGPVGVKALAIVSTKTPVGWALLVAMYGDFPPIQLSFGFVLTGIGGLIGVQHSFDEHALAEALASGGLDAILFPKDVAANAPQIIAALRAVFPTAANSFVVGPMLELGWGTPPLITAQIGVIVDPSKLALIGRVLVQIPPLVDGTLALLRLEIDFLGVVTFDPFRVAFDGELRNSRVGPITLTGQFAFRAEFGRRPYFLLSAGGFHPAFTEIPADIPQPFQRIGASFAIGIIGISLTGYFATSSATHQAGAELRVWADFGICGVEGGLGFDAICVLEPSFHFLPDIFAYLTVDVIGHEFTGIRVTGRLEGPGRWRLAGHLHVDTPFFLPDVNFSIDESWGKDVPTPPITISASDALLAEAGKPANWSAQAPRDGEHYITLAKGVANPEILLAHPMGMLTFQQKLLPLKVPLARIGSAHVVGPNRFELAGLVLGGAAAGGIQADIKGQFAAAQFFDVSEADKLAKPSFEAFDAGAQLDDSAFTGPEAIHDVLDYETADITLPPPARRLLVLGLAVSEDGLWAARLGAAGRSILRQRSQLRAVPSPSIRIDPPRHVVADDETLASADIWSSSRWISVFAAAGAGPRAQVVERVEAFA
jgi:hypothetical protein